jgi:hypothetical protein
LAQWPAQLYSKSISSSFANNAKVSDFLDTKTRMFSYPNGVVVPTGEEISPIYSTISADAVNKVSFDSILHNPIPLV